MKLAVCLLVAVGILSTTSANGIDATYIGSTPAGKSVRIFLGIPLHDSIDFIRWKISFRNNKYRLHCNYGIGKPNTNGFFNGGKKIDLEGSVTKEKNVYRLNNGNQDLFALDLNSDLLHLLDEAGNLLVGNGGWSYTLNNLNPVGIAQVSRGGPPIIFKDSISYEGRTPCKVPGVVPPGVSCYKLKWLVIFYAEEKMTRGRYKILGTPWRTEGSRTGNWKARSDTKGRTMYELTHDNGKGIIYLLILDDNILVFTEPMGNPLVGDEDFSYTLNRRN